MKILYYSSHPNLNLASPSGYGTHMREMIHAFTELGHEVRPVIMGGTTLGTSNLAIKGRSPVKKLVASCVPDYVWESAKDYRLINFDDHARLKIEKEIMDFQPDIIYERATYLQLSGVRAASKRRIQHVLEVNAPYVEERKELQGNSYYTKKGIKTEEQQLEKTDKIVVVSSALRDYFASAYQIETKKFVITPNAVNPAILKISKNRTAQLKADLQLEHEVIIGFVGSIFPWHGVDLLIDAYTELIRAGNACIHLLVIGDGETLPSLKVKAAKAGLSGKITFTGNIPHEQVFNYLELMDICVMGKSNWYGSPVKIFEYGAMGKAVIAPDNVPVRDVCRNMENAVLVQPTVKNIYKALHLLVNNPQLRGAIAINFKEKVLSQHTWINNAERVIAALA